MYVPQIIPTRVSSLRPTKRNIVHKIYAAEQFTQNIKPELPPEARGSAQWVSDMCKAVRLKLTKPN